jgi:nicotinamide-nucleotide amidase
MTRKTCIDPSLVDHAENVLRVLKERGSTVVTAESCTAGLIAAVLSQVDGAGEVLHGSFVTYTKANKVKELGLDVAMLEQQGSVNADVVHQLACGALERSPADIALAVSGVLGPSPDEDGNPVGLVFIGCCRREGPVRFERKDYGKRPHDELRRAVVLDALTLLERCAGEAHAA